MKLILGWLFKTATRKWLTSLVAIAAVGAGGWKVYDRIYDRGYDAAKLEWDKAIAKQERLHEQAKQQARAEIVTANARIDSLRAALAGETTDTRRLRDELQQARALSRERAGRVIEVPDTGTCYVYDAGRLARMLNQQRYPRTGAVSASNEGRSTGMQSAADIGRLARSP